MSFLHKFYLSLGSNIEPAVNLVHAINELRKYGEIGEISSPWESRPVRSAGPNFLNICLSFIAGLNEEDLKFQILRPVETALGRVRTLDKDAPRTIDIDVIMMDGRPLNAERWGNAFVISPMAELLPHFAHPLSRKQLVEAALEAQAATWIVRQPNALKKTDQ